MQQYTCPRCNHIGAHPAHLPPPKCHRCEYLVVMMKSHNGEILGEPDILHMTNRQMFEQSFKRPHNYFQLGVKRQWEIDNELGILDWRGHDLTAADLELFYTHYALTNITEHCWKGNVFPESH